MNYDTQAAYVHKVISGPHGEDTSYHYEIMGELSGDVPLRHGQTKEDILLRIAQQLAPYIPAIPLRNEVPDWRIGHDTQIPEIPLDMDEMIVIYTRLIKSGLSLPT